jgi:hypothetical protein
MTGSLPYNCKLRGDSPGAKVTIRSVLALPWTNAVAITISLTYIKPDANSRHNVRNGAFVTPAIGAKTMGDANSMLPIFNGFMASGFIVTSSNQ